MTSYRTRAYIFLLIVAIIWGAATPVIKFTLGGISPFSFLAYRFFLAGIFGAFAVIFIKKGHQAIRENFWELVIFGFITTTLTLSLLFLGLNKTTVLDTTLIVSVSPLVVAVFGVIFLKEHITSREKVGMGIAFFGTLLTVIEPLLADGIKSFQVVGNLFIVANLIVGALSAIMAKKLIRKNVPEFALINVAFVVGAFTSIPFLFIETTPTNFVHTIVQLSLPYQLGVFFMAFISGTLAYALWAKGQKSIEVSEAGLFVYLQPIFAAPLAVFWLKETISMPFVIGAVVIATGVIIAEYKKKNTTLT